MAQKIHRFRAHTLGEAARNMRETLGESAVVIGTRHVTEGGLFGLFGKPADIKGFLKRLNLENLQMRYLMFYIK